MKVEAKSKKPGKACRSTTGTSVKTPAPAPERVFSGSRGPKKESRGARPQEDWKVQHPNAAGIDIGAREHWVGVGRGRAARRFGTCTPDLDEMVDWLRECGIEDVAMESTGMYWLPVYERLEEAGFRVILADARQTKNTAGRKSDLLDCEWICQLHTYGLLRAAFRPTDAVCRLRTVQRHRRTLVAAAGRSVQHMQKALDGMNLHVHHALSDLTGTSGMAMIKAILKGERDPQALAALADRRVKQSAEKLAAALTGNYRDEELFVLGQALESYEHYQSQISACDAKILVQLEALCALCPDKPAPAAPAAPAATAAQNPPAAPETKAARRPRIPAKEQGLHALLQRLFGVDLTAIPGLGVLAVLTLLSEIGTDMSRWRSAGAFASWLGLSPNRRISGGRLLSTTSRKVVNRAATILRIAAMTAGKTDTPLGCFYRRKTAQYGAPKAITATARKMACLIYEMVSAGESYRAQDAAAYQKRFDEHRFKSLSRRAKALGYQLVEIKEENALKENENDPAAEAA